MLGTEDKSYLLLNRFLDVGVTLSEGRAAALWPWGRPWPGPKGSGQGPAEVGPGPWGQARAGPDPALLINHVNIT